MGQAPDEAKANPILSDVAAPVPLDTTGLANDPGVGKGGRFETTHVCPLLPGRSLG